MKHVLAGAIRGYQFLLSPWLGNQCRFYPTCSEYARLAIIEHGTLKGGWLTLRRTLKCHPWHPGGIDLVPERTRRYGSRKTGADKISANTYGAKRKSTDTCGATRISIANEMPTTTNKKPGQS